MPSPCVARLKQDASEKTRLFQQSIMTTKKHDVSSQDRALGSPVTKSTLSIQDGDPDIRVFCKRGTNYA